MAETTKKAPANLWAKLFDIQKSVKGFVNNTDSDKQKPGEKKSAYQYTPGAEIITRLREKMDEHGIMLIPNMIDESHHDIEYNVYKFINSEPRSFLKKEVLCTVTYEYTWIDTTTGEQCGPFKAAGMGANGTDKSLASAIALAERYFILKFFHIPTWDPADEPDAHDSSNLPGIPANAQPMNATDRQIVFQNGAPAAPRMQMPPQPQPQPQPQAVYPAPAVQAPAPVQAPPQPTYYPAQPQMQVNIPGQQPVGQQVNVFTQVPSYVSPAGGPGGRSYEPNDPMIDAAERDLAQFDKGTTTFNEKLQVKIDELANAGYSVRDSFFVLNLMEGAAARRENRKPSYKA